jgi:hypothetical protein
MESYATTDSPLFVEKIGCREGSSIVDLVAMLRSHAAADHQRSAAARLFRHAFYTADRVIIAQCGGIDALFRTLETASDYYCQLSH